LIFYVHVTPINSFISLIALIFWVTAIHLHAHTLEHLLELVHLGRVVLLLSATSKVTAHSRHPHPSHVGHARHTGHSLTSGRRVHAHGAKQVLHHVFGLALLLLSQLLILFFIIIIVQVFHLLYDVGEQTRELLLEVVQIGIVHSRHTLSRSVATISRYLSLGLLKIVKHLAGCGSKRIGVRWLSSCRRLAIWRALGLHHLLQECFSLSCISGWLWLRLRCRVS